MATKSLALYKLGVVLDVDGAKGVTALKATDKELKAVDQNARRAERSIGVVGNTLNKLKAFTFGSGGSGGLLPGLSHISNIIQGIPQIGNLAHALVSPLKDAAEEGVRFNMLIESAEIGFKGVTGGAKQSARYVKQLTDFAANNPIFNTQGTVRAARMMSIFGFETKKTTDYIKSWGSAIAAGTGTLDEEKLQGVVTAFGQMRSKGKVSAEEMNQLTERGIPAWEMLSKAINKTTAETMKLAELGKLRGGAAVDAITAMLDRDPRFAGAADAFGRSLEGLILKGQDLREVSQGQATKALFDSLKRTYQAALSDDNSRLVQTMAGGINTAITPVAGLVEGGAKALLTGDIKAIFADAYKAGLDAANPFKGLGTGAITSVAEGAKEAGGKVVSAIKTVADDGQQGLRDVWQQNSPSKLFYGLGFGAMKSLAHGLQDGGGGATERFRESIEQIKAEFERITGRKLRGVVGQTETHTRLNFDHSQGADIAVAPGTADARLVERLAAQYGIPVLRQPGARRNRRGRVTSTGAHLHLGRISPNLNRSDAYVVSEASGTPEMQGGAGVSFNAGNPMPVRVMNGQELLGFKPPAGAIQLPKTPVYENNRIVGYDASEPSPTKQEAELPILARNLQEFYALAPDLPRATLKTKESLKNAEGAVGSFAKSVIMANRDMKGMFSQIAGFLPQGQASGKRGFFSKLLGIASPLLGFIPGVGPLLSTLAGIGSSAAAGDWGGALMATAGGFAKGGAFRGSGGGNSGAGGGTGGKADLPGRARGGPVRRGRAYVVGEHREEVFEPDEDGFVHPSIDAFARSRGGSGGASSSDGENIWRRLEAHLARLSGSMENFDRRLTSMRPGDVLAAGAHENPGAIGSGMKVAMSRDPKVTEWMTRRVNGR